MTRDPFPTFARLAVNAFAQDHEWTDPVDGRDYRGIEAFARCLGYTDRNAVQFWTRGLVGDGDAEARTTPPRRMRVKVYALIATRAPAVLRLIEARGGTPKAEIQEAREHIACGGFPEFRLGGEGAPSRKRRPATTAA